MDQSRIPRIQPLVALNRPGQYEAVDEFQCQCDSDVHDTVGLTFLYSPRDWDLPGIPGFILAMRTDILHIERNVLIIQYRPNVAVGVPAVHASRALCRRFFKFIEVLQSNF